LINFSSASLVKVKHVHSVSTLNKTNIWVLVQFFYHVYSCLNLSNGDKSCTILVDGIGDHLCCLSISLRLNDSGFLFFLLHLYNKFSSFSFLLSYLLSFDGLRELSRELKMSQSDIVKDETEIIGSSLKLLSDILRNFFSHSD